MKQSIRFVVCVFAFVVGMISVHGQNDSLIHAGLEMSRVFPYDLDVDMLEVNHGYAYADSTFIFGFYKDGTILSGPEDARIRRSLLSPTASCFVTDTDTLLALDCGGLWLIPIGSDEPRTRIKSVDVDSRFVKGIDHGFALRQGGKVYVHQRYEAAPGDSIDHPESNDYWSVGADGNRSASWGWGPSTATVQWSKGDVGTVELPTNGQATCAVLSDSVIAVWNTNLLISRDRGRTWHHYATQDIDPSLPEEDVTYRSFRSIEVRGTDLYVSLRPEKANQLFYYVSSDLGLTWRRYAPASAPPYTEPIPYRVGIGSERAVAGVRFVTDVNGVRIVEAMGRIYEDGSFPFRDYGIGPVGYTSADTLYTWTHSLDSCIAFDPMVDGRTFWLWFKNGTLLTKHVTDTTYKERTLPTSPLLSCWVVDSITAIIRGEEGAYVTHDAGATWTADPTYDGLLAFTPILNEARLSLWRTATNDLEIRSSDSISSTGTLVASLPNTEASQFLLTRYGASGCVVQAIGGSAWTCLSMENFTDPASTQLFTDNRARFADSLTSRLGIGQEFGESIIIPRIYDEGGWVYGISFDVYIGLRFYAIPVGVEESTSAPSRISLFPNPAHDLCIVRTADGTEISSIQVYSALGTLVLAQTPNGSEARLDTSTLPSGVYHLSVSGPVIGHTFSRICVTP